MSIQKKQRKRKRKGSVCEQEHDECSTRDVSKRVQLSTACEEHGPDLEKRRRKIAREDSSVHFAVLRQLPHSCLRTQHGASALSLPHPTSHIPHQTIQRERQSERKRTSLITPETTAWMVVTYPVPGPRPSDPPLGRSLGPAAVRG
eukprot:2655994-Rhodomonas_salina.2